MRTACQTAWETTRRKDTRFCTRTSLNASMPWTAPLQLHVVAKPARSSINSPVEQAVSAKPGANVRELQSDKMVLRVNNKLDHEIFDLEG